MSLIAELKRRKVFKVGAAYLVVAWLVVQVGATVAPQLGLPEWAPRLITLLVLLGFPISLVVAWMVDVTPEGIRLESAPVGNKRFFGIAAVLAALAVGWFLRGGVTGGDPAAAVAEAPLGPQSTAVLPFVNMSADKDNEYFSDGLTETLLHKLAQVTELKVAARTSSFAFKGRNSDVRAIGAELGVATVVEGSVQRAGDTLRITAQLVRTADGSHIWSKSYDRKQADLFAIQDEIAGAVTEALVGALVPAAQAAIAKGNTADLAAYDLYARGLQDKALNTYESLDRAERLMQEAIARDPKYVDAMVGLLDTWRAAWLTGKFDFTEYLARITPWMDRIAALDPNNAMLMGYRAVLARQQQGVEAAGKLYLEAVTRHPGNAELRGMYAIFLTYNRQEEEGLRQLDLAVELDPLNPEYHLNRAGALNRLERWDEVEQAARRAMAIDPTDPSGPAFIADLAARRGALADAVAGYLQAQRLDPNDHEIAAALAQLLGRLDEHAAADAWLAESRRLNPGNLNADAEAVTLAFARGDAAAALEGALAIAPRHEEERIGNWSVAVSLGCLAAAELGRTAELRGALERTGMVPREFTTEGLQALVTPRLDLKHLTGHLVSAAPCLIERGAAGAARRAQLLETMVALQGADWAQERGQRILEGVLREDRERIVAALLPEPGKPDAVGDIERRMAFLRWLGLDQDPRVVAWHQRAEAKLAESRAALPARLAADGLSLTP